jgi:biopolymer transport protein ExbB
MKGKQAVIKQLVGVLSIGLIVAGFSAAPLWAQERKPEIGPLPGEESPLKLPGTEEGEETVAGDNKIFTVSTDDDINSLEVGDIYKNEDSSFKVVGIDSKTAKGGKFKVQRIVGKTDPQRKWRRVSGAGPINIVSRVTLIDLYIQGGMFLHPIAALFMIMLILTVNCIIVDRRNRQCPSQLVTEGEAALQAGDLKKFEDLSVKHSGLLAHICRAMIDRFDYSNIDDIKYRVEVAAGRQIGRLRVPVKALNLIAVAAPLLGLLGTIVGMVIVFEAVAGATGAAKASALAAGIRVKLFSTTAALCVAIPALLLFFVFNQRVGVIVAECETITERFLHLISIHKRGQENGEKETSQAP